MGAPSFVMVVDLALAIIVIELAVILWASRAAPTGRVISPKALLPTVLSGLGLLLALRAVAAGADPLVALAALSFGGMAHVVDLVVRLRRGGKAAPETKQPVEKAVPMRS